MIVRIYLVTFSDQHLEGNVIRDANQFYIGKTKRHLATREGEHKQANSTVYDHLNDCQVCKDRFSVELLKILDVGRNDVETTIKEALYIKSHKPVLDRQL